MKRIIALLSVFLFLNGCSGTSKNTEFCERCDTQTEYYIETKFGAVCLDCFKLWEYMSCSSCKDFYIPYDQGGNKIYCDSCILDWFWLCGLCGYEYPLDSLAELGEGYYVCANCLMHCVVFAQDKDEDRSRFFASDSAWDFLLDHVLDTVPPRDEYLAEHKKAD